MSRGPKGNVDRFQGEDFPLDAVTQSVITKVELRYSAAFSLQSFQTEALEIFQKGMNPIVEYYLQGDMGEYVDFVIRHPKPWSPMALAEILRHNYRSFKEQQVTANVQQLGNSIAKLLTNPHLNPESELVTTVKILGLIMAALSMIPKEKPRYMQHVPTLEFTDVIQTYKAKRKEMRKLWKSCVEYVDMQGETRTETFASWPQVPSSEPTSTPRAPSPDRTNVQRELYQASRASSVTRMHGTGFYQSAIYAPQIQQGSNFHGVAPSGYSSVPPYHPIQAQMRPAGYKQRGTGWMEGQTQQRGNAYSPAAVRQPWMPDPPTPPAMTRIQEHVHQGSIQSNAYVPVQNVVRPAVQSVRTHRCVAARSQTLPVGYGTAQGGNGGRQDQVPTLNPYAPSAAVRLTWRPEPPPPQGTEIRTQTTDRSNPYVLVQEAVRPAMHTSAQAQGLSPEQPADGRTTLPTGYGKAKERADEVPTQQHPSVYTPGQQIQAPQPQASTNSFFLGMDKADNPQSKTMQRGYVVEQFHPPPGGLPSDVLRGLEERMKSLMPSDLPNNPHD